MVTIESKTDLFVEPEYLESQCMECGNSLTCVSNTFI